MNSKDYAPYTDSQIKNADQQELYEIFLNIRKRNLKVGALTFHENYHYWQGLRLPYMFWSSFISINHTFKSFIKLSTNNQDYLRWNVTIPTLSIYSKKHSVVGELGSLEINDEGNTIANLSIIDLLEAATTMAEFQVSVGYTDRVEPIVFSRWCKRNPSYTNVFKFVSKLFNDEKLVLRLLIPFVNGAFFTSQPVKAFIYLLNKFETWQKNDSFAHEFLSQKEPCKWNLLVEQLLDSLLFETEENSSSNIFDPRFFKLTLENWVNSHFIFQGVQKLHHPFINKQADKWIELCKVNEGFKSVLDYPGYLNDQIIKYVSQKFNPAVTFAKFTFASGESRVLTFGQLGYGVEYDWPLPLIDLFTIYSTMKRAAMIQYFDKHRMCGHKNCSFFESNFCNSYPVIPRDFNECGFPNRINYLTKAINERA
ncbi:hypothetical protein [Tenacibaculum amylolyticum]|uniref:hypothetical protein n=1 Tax=Tenacibaculum amylolyticum TaxID=104269 RepID=UPI0038B5C2CE